MQAVTNFEPEHYILRTRTQKAEPEQQACQNVEASTDQSDNLLIHSPVPSPACLAGIQYDSSHSPSSVLPWPMQTPDSLPSCLAFLSSHPNNGLNPQSLPFPITHCAGFKQDSMDDDLSSMQSPFDSSSMHPLDLLPVTNLSLQPLNCVALPDPGMHDAQPLPDTPLSLFNREHAAEGYPALW